MGGQPLRLGPFIGGINSNSDPSAIADSELVDCNNFELDIDGSLTCRPPFEEILNNSSFAERIVLLGVAQIGGNVYLIGSNSGGVYYWTSNSWTTITTTFQATCMAQYMNKIWLIAKIGSANPGGSWDGATFTAVAAIPKGSACAIHKERLYVVPGTAATVNESRLTFSNAGDLTTWPGGNFIDIAPGDGQHLVDLTIYQDNLLLFKEDSTHILAYDTTPANAVRRYISTTIGATKAHCVANYENSVFVYHEGEVYEIVNLDFNRINTKVPFLYDPTTPSSATFTEEVFLSVFGDRLIVRYFNRVYVYGLRTRTWTRWESSSDKLHYFGPIIAFPSNVSSAVNDQYYAGSCVNTQKNLVRMNNGFDSTTEEEDLTDSVDITCSILTKNYDLAVSHQFKRLFWWGADVLTSNDILGAATPVVSTFEVTWATLATYLWNQLNTWQFPTLTPPGTTTIVSTTSGVLHKFAKFPKGLRFRQINFQIVLTSSGKTTDGPAKIYNLIVQVETRAVVPQASN